MPTLPGCGGHSRAWRIYLRHSSGRSVRRRSAEGYDALEVGEEPLDLLALVEDELLLALPIVPAHDPEVCQHPAGFVVEDEPESSEVEDKRPNPFSVLAQLKRDPNV